MKKLNQFGIIPFSNRTLKSVLGNYKSPNDKISSLMSSGDIIQIKKGMYVTSNEYRNQKISTELLANVIYGPSYISLDFALSYYNMIPEKVTVVTSVSTKRAINFSTYFGDFKYTHASLNYYHIGITQQSINNQFNFLIATPEKALCDKIVFTKNTAIKTLKSMHCFLMDDLRIDLQNIKQLNPSVIEECAAVGYKQKELELLIKIIKN